MSLLWPACPLGFKLNRLFASQFSGDTKVTGFQAKGPLLARTPPRFGLLGAAGRSFKRWMRAAFYLNSALSSFTSDADSCTGVTQQPTRWASKRSFGRTPSSPIRLDQAAFFTLESLKVGYPSSKQRLVVCESHAARPCPSERPTQGSARSAEAQVRPERGGDILLPARQSTRRDAVLYVASRHDARAWTELMRPTSSAK